MIKIFTLLSSMIFIGITAYTQFDVGQRLLGGNASFSISKEDNLYTGNTTTKNTNFFLNPTFARFKKPGVLNGIGFSYSHFHQSMNYIPGSQITSTTNNSIGVNVFSQRFFQLTKGLNFTVQTTGIVSYNFGKQTFYLGTMQNKPKSNGYGIGLNVAPGISYRLTQRLLFDGYLNNFVSLGYSHGKTDNVFAPYRGESSSFYLSSSLSNTSLSGIGLGFRWLMRKQ